MNLTEILSHDGKVMDTQVTLTAEAIELGSGIYPVSRKSPVSLSIRNAGNKKLEVTGSVDISVLIPCDRCLEEVETPFALEIDRELLVKAGEDMEPDEKEENRILEGYNLDVDQLVCSEILLNWPMKVLCSEECKGVCSKCGSNLNQSECGCDHTELDPRMARILDIFQNNKEV